MHSPLTKLNFPPIKLRARQNGESISVWDKLRRCYIVLTPEEWVRQHAIAFLESHMGIAAQQITVEYPVALNGQNQRADIVVLNRQGAPHIVVECKAPEVPISQQTLDQAVRYNSILKAPYIILTNGITHHLYQRTDECGGYATLTSFESVTM